MATSLFFKETDQNPAAAKPQGLLSRHMYTHMVGTGEIRLETPRSRGRKPGSKAAQNHKKIRQRGMGVAQLERLREQEEKKMAVTSSSTLPNPKTRLPVTEPVLIGSFPLLQGLPSYGRPTSCPVVGSSGSGSGPVVPKINGSFGRFAGLCSGSGSGQFLIEPSPALVYPPETWGFLETSKELSSMPNPHKKIYDGDAIRSNGGGMSKYGMISSMNGHDSPVVSLNCSTQCFDGAINHTGSMEMLGSYMMRGNPRNGGPAQILIKEYEFFPGKYASFPRKYWQSAYTEEMEAPVVSVSDCSTNTSAIDLSLKL